MDANTPGAGRLQPSGPACAVIAPQVALLGTGTLAADEEADVRAHLATCAYCRAAERVDVLLAGALRRGYGESAQSASSAGAWFAAEDMDALLARAREETPPAHLTTRAAASASSPNPERHARGHGHSTGWRTAVAPLVAVLVIALGAALLFSRGGRRETGPAQPATTAINHQALADDTVLLSTQDGVYALRASDGAVRWHYTAVPENEAGTPSGAIAVAGNVVYAISGVPNPSNPTFPTAALVALRLSDGHLLWSRPLTFSDYGEAMTLADGVLYLSPSTVARGGSYSDIEHLTVHLQAGDYTAYALRASDGKVLWRVTAHDTLSSVPYAANGTVYLGTTTSIEAVRASDGSIMWSTPMGAGGGTPQGTLKTYVNGMSFDVQGSMLVVNLEVVRIQSETQDGTGWQGTTTSELTGLDASTGAAEGFACSAATDDAPPIALPIQTGAGMLYQEGGGIWATPLDGIGSCRIGWFANLGASQVGFTYANGVLYSTDWGQQSLHTDPPSTGNYTHAVDAATGHELWRTKTNGGMAAQIPSVGGGLVFAGANDSVIALDASNGAKVWRFLEPKGALISAPPVLVVGA